MLKEKTHALTVGTKYQKAKQHVQDNRNSYLAGAGGLTVGALGVLLLTRAPMQINNTVTPVFNNMPVFNNSNTVNFGGYAHKIVKCIETGEIWEAVKDAAQTESVSISSMSKHLHGHTDHINGRHFEIIGLGTTG